MLWSLLQEVKTEKFGDRWEQALVFQQGRDVICGWNIVYGDDVSYFHIARRSNLVYSGFCEGQICEGHFASACNLLEISRSTDG